MAIAADGVDYNTIAEREPYINISKSDIAEAKSLFIEIIDIDGVSQSIRVDSKDIKSLEFKLIAQGEYNV